MPDYPPIPVPKMPILGGRYKHRNGHTYEVRTFATDADGDVQVVHVGMHDGRVWTRSLSNFCGVHTDTALERFTKVEG
jgi:hypothetical protein